MISQIMNAFCIEIQAIFADTGETVLRDTQYNPSEMALYTMPVVILSLKDSPDIQQLSGGVTQAEWAWTIKSYFYDVNSNLDPDAGFSTEAYEIIDKIRNHISKMQWLTQDFKDIVTNYGYKLTLNGTDKAEPLQHDGGICPGFMINYDSIGIDRSTGFTQYSNDVVNEVALVPPILPALSVSDTTLAIAKPAGSTNDFDIISNTSWTISSSQSWLSLSNAFGEGAANIILTATLNSSTNPRTAIVTISAPLSELSDKTIIVTQSGT
jgi:hypothetical protein